MNILALDIGNTNITVGFFPGDSQEFIEKVPGRQKAKLAKLLGSAWEKVPVIEGSKEKKRDGVIAACSVKPAWTRMVEDVVSSNMGEKVLLVGRDIPLPMETAVDEPERVGTDRIVSAAAAYAVVEDAVAVADFGTAVTIDLVDSEGVFLGGVIFPGPEMAAKALAEQTAQLPEVAPGKPDEIYGRNTAEAIRAGVYYSAVGALQEVVRRYAEKLGHWPQTIVTGRGAELIKADAQLVANYVPDLVVRGVVLAYKKFAESQHPEL